MPPNGSELLKWGEDVYVGATYAVIIIIPWPWICRQMRVNAVLSYPTWFLCYSHMATKYSMASSLSLYFWALKSPSKNGLDRNMPRPHVPLLENSTGLCKDAIYIYIYIPIYTKTSSQIYGEITCVDMGWQNIERSATSWVSSHQFLNPYLRTYTNAKLPSN